jgi:hypothetical protein
LGVDIVTIIVVKNAINIGKMASVDPSMDMILTSPRDTDNQWPPHGHANARRTVAWPIEIYGRGNLHMSLD